MYQRENCYLCIWKRVINEVKHYYRAIGVEIRGKTKEINVKSKRGKFIAQSFCTEIILRSLEKKQVGAVKRIRQVSVFFWHRMNESTLSIGRKES